MYFSMNVAFYIENCAVYAISVFVYLDFSFNL